MRARDPRACTCTGLAMGDDGPGEPERKLPAKLPPERKAPGKLKVYVDMHMCANICIQLRSIELRHAILTSCRPKVHAGPNIYLYIY